jgi:hypothetical protein
MKMIDVYKDKQGYDPTTTRRRFYRTIVDA